MFNRVIHLNKDCEKEVPDCSGTTYESILRHCATNGRRRNPSRIARNHPFADGNKRTAWVIARLFLALNEVQIAFDKGDAIRTMLALAAGEMDEATLAAWFREHVVSG